MRAGQRAGRALRLLAALALLLPCAWAANQAARWGWANFQSIEARTLLKRAMNGAIPMNASTWNRVREGLVIALAWDPDNPEYHQAMGDAYLLRLTRTPGDRAKMAPYFEIALKHYARAAARRPTWPFAHAGIVTAKQHMGRYDADFRRALSLASHFGPWELAVQDQLIAAGYRSWAALGEAEREIIRGNLRRAHQWRPGQTATLLASLKQAAPPCDQLQVVIAGACSTAPTASSAVSPGVSPGASPARSPAPPAALITRKAAQ